MYVLHNIWQRCVHHRSYIAKATNGNVSKICFVCNVTVHSLRWHFSRRRIFISMLLLSLDFIFSHTIQRISFPFCSQFNIYSYFTQHYAQCDYSKFHSVRLLSTSRDFSTMTLLVCVLLGSFILSIKFDASYMDFYNPHPFAHNTYIQCHSYL